MNVAANRKVGPRAAGKNVTARDRHTELAAWAREQVASWPPLTDEQRELVSRALGGAIGPSG